MNQPSIRAPVKCTLEFTVHRFQNPARPTTLPFSLSTPSNNTIRMSTVFTSLCLADKGLLLQTSAKIEVTANTKKKPWAWVSFKTLSRELCFPPDGEGWWGRHQWRLSRVRRGRGGPSSGSRSPRMSGCPRAGPSILFLSATKQIFLKIEDDPKNLCVFRATSRGFCGIYVSSSRPPPFLSCFLGYARTLTKY